jgi:uncharacterized protein (DUF885 family)
MVILSTLPAACGGLDFSPEYSPQGARSRDERFERFLEEVFQTRLDRDPELATRLGDRRGLDRWTDRSERARQEDAELVQRDLERLRLEFGLEQLDAVGREGFKAFEFESELALESYRWRYHDWPLGVFDGLQVSLPTLLAHEHPVQDDADAAAWIRRLEGLTPLAAGLGMQLEERGRAGLLPSTSVIDASLASMRALLLGAPFQPEQNDSRILAAFGRKLELCTALTPEQRLNRLAHASSILRENFQPAWRSLIKTLESLRELAGQDEGTWRLPDGDEYYAYCLRRATASTLDPEDVHRDSMAEVRLVQEEIRTLKNRLGFAGSLNAFFDHLRSDAGLYGTDDPASRADLLERMRTWMRGMQPSLGEVIRESELAPLELRALSVSFAPAGSGSLYTVGPQGATAILRVDLSSPRRMPIHELEARTYFSLCHFAGNCH